MEAGKRFAPSDNCNLVVLAVASQAALLDAGARMEMAGIRFALFYEPDDNLGYSAVCSEQLSGKQRLMFRNYKLWQGTAIAAARKRPP